MHGVPERIQRTVTPDRICICALVAQGRMIAGVLLAGGTLFNDKVVLDFDRHIQVDDGLGEVTRAQVLVRVLQAYSLLAV